MAIPLVINGNTYYYPQQGDIDWGPEATDWASAVTSGMLQKAGGLFTLQAEVDFGSAFGIKSLYYKTRSANIATAGQFLLARPDVISWRNQANNADLALGVSSSNVLQFNGVDIVTGSVISAVTDTATIDLTITGGTTLSADIKTNSITNAMINSAAAIVYSKLSLTNSIVNADINSAAAIAYSKLALTGSIVNADVSASAAIAYSKLASMTAGSVLLGSASNVPTVTALTGDVVVDSSGVTSISAGVIVNADINASAAIAYSKLAALTGSRALESSAGGVIQVSAVTSTELGYLTGVTSAIQTQLNAKLALAGGTMSGPINMGNNLITNVTDPVSAQDAATKAYVDTVAQGLNAKTPVVVATTANITLSGEQTIDGVLTSASRVLVKNQSTAANNGIYVSAAGAWTRATDANTWAELISAFVFVSQGTTQADTGWVCTVDAGGTLGVTAVTWVQFSSAGVILAGNGLTKTGNTLDVNVDNSTTEISGNNVIVKSGGITNTQVNASAAIAYSKLALTGSIVNADINASAAIAYSKLALTGSIVNADVNASAAIAFSKLATLTAGNLLLGSAGNVATSTAMSGDITIDSSGVTAIGSGVIVNADINAAAAIALSKLATVTASRAIESSAGGVLQASSVTSTELGYLSGVTSAIQTQITAKMTNPMTTGGDVIYGGASGAPTRLANGSSGQVLTSAGGTSAPTWATPAGGYTVTAVSSNITLASANIYLVSTASARSLQLPSPSATFMTYIKDSTGQAQTNNITLVRAASEQIEGVAASKVLQTNWGSWLLVSNGTNWFLL